ncbi:MAG: DUF4432 family protein [Ruminococcaceae bacterium]|nr:DUF4432 family protein [Oscillospiraceae bacterium]
MNREELLKVIGSVEQIGGVRDFVFNDGRAKGVRAIEINTGKICFTLLPDRGLDIANASFMGTNVSWISKTGITDPRFYEKADNGFLRGFFGGLVTTCGLKNIGGGVGEYGLHDRVSNTPAEKVSVFADWVGDDYCMEVSAHIRQCKVFGENIVIKRTIKTKLFSNSFTLTDTIVNEGHSDEDFAIAYHCNFGYPLVREGAKIINVPEDIAAISGPIHGKEEECIGVPQSGDRPTVGIENGEMGAYITYDKQTMPSFLVWKMLGESEYVVGLEPRTTNFGGQNIINNNAFVALKPFEEYKSRLEFEFKSL